MFGGGFGGFGNFGFEEESQHQEQKEVDNETFYKILGVDKKATPQEIKKAFRTSCLKGEYRHPDKGGDESKFKQLNEAHATISDPEKREIYDKYGEEGLKKGGGGHGGMDMNDIFGGIFGGRGGGGGQKRQKKAEGKLKEVTVTLEEVYNGKMATFDFKRIRCCLKCDGKGGSNVKKCTTCKGRGVVVKMVQLGPGMYSQSQAHCGDCRGQGETMDAKDKCKECKGQKISEQTKKMEVPIEPGVPDNKEIIFNGEADEGPGIMAGDLHVRIKVAPHDKYTRKGADLYYNQTITLLEALSGFHTDIKLLSGKTLTLATIPGDVISDNQQKVVKGKGLPIYKNSFDHGNLYINFKVEFPAKNSLNKNVIEQLQQLLPGPKLTALDKSKNFEFLDDVQEYDQKKKQDAYRQDDDDEYEDDEDPRQRGQNVQCNQQ